LKAKKERRKQRRVLVNASKPKASKKKEEDEEIDGDEDLDQDEDKELLEKSPQATQPLLEDVEMQGEEPLADEQKERQKEKKSKKRLKREKNHEQEPLELEMNIESTLMDQDGAILDDMTANSMVENTDINQAMPSLEDFSFPMPSQPAPVSKAQLTLQGMDKAMLDAEVVDPSKKESLSLDTGSIAARLSSRMRKRLKDLEITQLFAGKPVDSIAIPSIRTQISSNQTTSWL
jgi:ATP-dependent RNA helicase DDX51/DBP6